MPERPLAIDPERLPALRAAAQLLHRPARSSHPADVARAICGAQAQDGRAGRLAFRARSGGFRAADVDRARTEERSLVRAWAMRGTMHLLAADDAGWLLPLFEPAVADNSSRRLAHFGIDAPTQERGLREIGRALEADGPLSRRALAERLARKGILLSPETRMHIFRLSIARAIACLGPDAGGQTRLVLSRDWLGERGPHEHQASLSELARRYLRAFGPATEADFAGWAGLALREIRSALAAIGGETRAARIGGQTAWMLAKAARPSRRRTVRLLPAWDTYLMGYRDRGFMAEPANWRRITPGGGIIRPTVVADGVAVGTWSSRRAGPRVRVELEPFGKLDDATLEAVEAEVADLGRFEEATATLE